MKGPGLRIEIDVRRVWLCAVCGQGQRLTMDITAPRCFCVRDGVPMKLAEVRRSGRIDLRPELRSMLDRIQGGEEFPRMTSPLTEASDGGPGGYGGSKPRNRTPRPERSGGDSESRPRESREALPQADAVTQPVDSPPPRVAVEPPSRLPDPTDEDEFGAGLGAHETSSPN